MRQPLKKLLCLLVRESDLRSALDLPTERSEATLCQSKKHQRWLKDYFQMLYRYETSLLSKALA